MELLGKNVILRIDKPYPQARNHIYTGKVVAYDGRLLSVDGMVFHFGRPSAEDPTGGLTTSGRAVRWIPIDRIQYVVEMPKGMDPYSTAANFRLTAEGDLQWLASERPDLIPE
jgi:hypothetical protein